MNTLAFFNIGPPEWVAIGLVSLLVFGRRLPEVGKNLGKSLVEFKKGLKGVKGEFDDVNDAVADVNDAVNEASVDLHQSASKLADGENDSGSKASV